MECGLHTSFSPFEIAQVQNIIFERCKKSAIFSGKKRYGGVPGVLGGTSGTLATVRLGRVTSGNALVGEFPDQSVEC